MLFCLVLGGMSPQNQDPASPRDDVNLLVRRKGNITNVRNAVHHVLGKSQRSVTGIAISIEHNTTCNARSYRFIKIIIFLIDVNA